jgi:hypothetical protein
VSQNEHVGTTPSHYEQEGEMHWDRQWRLYGRGYFVGQITKYLERYHKKGGLDDLKKANNFSKKLYELEKAAYDGTGPLGAMGTQPPVVAYHGEKVDPFVATNTPDDVGFHNAVRQEYQMEGDKRRWIQAVGGVTFGHPEGGVPVVEKCKDKPCDKDRDHDSHRFEPLPDYEGAVCHDCGAMAGMRSGKMPCPGKAQVDLVQPPIMTVWGPLSPYEPQGAGGRGTCPHCRGSGQVCCEWSTDVTPCPVCNSFGQ